VEWVIIDWLVCNRVREFGATILAGEWNLKDALFAGGALSGKNGLQGIARARIIRRLLRLILFFVVPIAAIWYGVQKENVVLILAGTTIGGLYLSWTAYLTARPAIIRLLGRQPPKSILQSKIELWDLMHNAYRRLGGPVVDPTRVQRALDAAAEKGAVWDGAVYAVLNRVIARDPTAWVTDDSHSYHGPQNFTGDASTG
jgi:hypothetical protein